MARSGNNGMLLAAGLIAGRGAHRAAVRRAGGGEHQVRHLAARDLEASSRRPFGVSLLVFVVIGWVLIRIPLANAGRPDEPAPPSAMV